MSKHTPGPWKICYGGGFPEQAVIRPDRASMTADEAVKIANVNGGRMDYIANARLIAAAPNLLRELVLARDCFAEICELVIHGHFDAAEDYADANRYEVAQSIRLALERAGLGEE